MGLLLLALGPLAPSASAASWTSQSAPTGIFTLQGMSCADTTHCFAVGQTATGTSAIAATLNGSTWNPQTAPAGLFLAGVSCPNTTHCFAVGESPSFGGAIVATANGSTWSSQTAPSGFLAMTAVDCVDATHCYAVGQTASGAGIVATTNGSTWASQTLPNGVATLGGVSCTTATSCFAVGSTTGGTATVLATTNGGATWTTQPIPTGSLSTTTLTMLNGISCIRSSNTCYATGWTLKSDQSSYGGSQAGTPAILKTTDGTSWQTQTAPAEVTGLNDVSCVDSTHCVVVGSNTVTLHAVAEVTTDGSTWSSQVLPSGVATLNAVSCADASACFLGGATTSLTASIIASTSPLTGAGASATQPSKTTALVTSAPESNASTARASAVATANVTGYGVNVDPQVLVGTDPNKSPYGQNLINTMQSSGIKIVRLIHSDTRIGLDQNNGWVSVWGNLNTHGISAIPALSMTSGSAGPGTTNGVVTDTGLLLQHEQEFLNAIRAQHGFNALPSNFVALDVMNEPRLTSPGATASTVPSLRVLADTIRANTNLPVFIGGWIRHTLDVSYESLAGQACQVGDLVSPHIYIGTGSGGATTPTLDQPATIRGVTQGFTTVTSPSFAPPAGSVIYAVFVANGSDMGTAQQLNSVTNTGTPLTWHRLVRSNAQTPTSLGGDAEVWWAYNSGAQPSGIQVTGNLAVPAPGPSPDGYLETLVYDDADPDQTSANATAVHSDGAAPPSASVTTTAPNSVVWGAVSNWTNDTKGTPATGQSLSGSSRNTTSHKAWWDQKLNAPVSAPRTTVTISDIDPSVAYNMVAFEVQGRPVTDLAVYQAAADAYLSGMAQAMQTAGCSKPVYVTEFGAQSGINQAPDWGSPAYQQAVIRGTYNALRANSAALSIQGGMIWQMAPYFFRNQQSFSLIQWNWPQTGQTTFMPAFYDLPTITARGIFP